MSGSSETGWSGLGKWLSSAAALLLILRAVPWIFDPQRGAAAGWNIFLGLLLFGAVASRNARAPAIGAAIAMLMAVRLGVGIAAGADPLDIGVEGVLLLLIGAAAYDLRKQRAALPEGQAPRGVDADSH